MKIHPNDQDFPLPILFGFSIWIFSLLCLAFVLLYLVYFHFKSRRSFSNRFDQICLTNKFVNDDEEEKSFYLNRSDIPGDLSSKMKKSILINEDFHQVESTSNHRSIISHLNSFYHQKPTYHLSIESIFSKDSLVE